MKTKGTWINFSKVPSKPGQKTERYIVATKEGNIPLGTIRWAGRWHKYAFYPMADTLFDPVCLTEIVFFLRCLMNARKKK